MPFIGGRNRNNRNNRNNDNNDDNVNDDGSIGPGLGSGPEDCEYCSEGLQCPYWYQDRYGNWLHDPTGIAGYDENLVQKNTYNVDVPTTPPIGKNSGEKPPKRHRLW